LKEQRQAKRFYVAGRVQGVGYRFFVQNWAEQLAIAGYVKNLADGRVEVYAIGGEEQLRELAQALRRGPRMAEVTQLKESEAELLSEFDSRFSVEL
jgi:acylphosphatase